jgi:hypothetical protein
MPLPIVGQIEFSCHALPTIDATPLVKSTIEKISDATPIKINNEPRTTPDKKFTVNF